MKKDNILIEFSYEEVRDIICDYYGIDEDDFDIDEYTNDEIHWAIINK